MKGILMQDIQYKTSYTAEEVEAAKQKYLDVKMAAINYLKEIVSILESAGDEPILGEVRKSMWDKFSLLDHSLLNKLDFKSLAYFEAKEAEEKFEN